MISESAAFIALNKQLVNESDYLMLLPAEADISIETQTEMTRSMRQNNLANVYVAQSNGLLVGYIGVTPVRFAKNKHCCQFAIGVLKSHQRKAIGTKLIQAMEQWAAAQAIFRIELSVVVDNVAAIAFYQRCGYHVEGTKTASLKIENGFVDEFLMAKLIISTTESSLKKSPVE